jgi:RNA polymerase sigma-70 factor (ECF subfamily)
VDWTELAGRAASGDHRAVAELMRAVQGDIWRYCAAFVGRADAEDVAQDALLRIVRNVEHYRREGSGRAWVLTITRRACVDHIRAQVRRRSMLERVARLDDTAHPGGPEADRGLSELADVLGALDVERRHAFVLTQVLGLSYAEAAAVSHCPVGTIRSRVARARLQLLEALRPTALGADRCGGEP